LQQGDEKIAADLQKRDLFAEEKAHEDAESETDEDLGRDPDPAALGRWCLLHEDSWDEVVGDWDKGYFLAH
jgi:hypothetical protein